MAAVILFFCALGLFDGSAARWLRALQGVALLLLAIANAGVGISQLFSPVKTLQSLIFLGLFTGPEDEMRVYTLIALFAIAVLCGLGGLGSFRALRARDGWYYRGVAPPLPPADEDTGQPV